MLTVFREELIKQLLVVPSIFDEYARLDFSFIDHAIDWHNSVEKIFARFRSQNVSLIAAQRSRIIAAKDGFQDPALFRTKTSATKVLRITTANCLAISEATVRGQVDSINAQLEPLRLKMAQLISVASSIQPIPLPPIEPHTTWLLDVWEGLAVNGDTRPMFNYLKASLSLVDRLYLLDELISNVITQGHRRKRKSRRKMSNEEDRTRAK